MKCKRCGNEINLQIFGMPDDLCYGCLTIEENDKIVKMNIAIAAKQAREDKEKEKR